MIDLLVVVILIEQKRNVRFWLLIGMLLSLVRFEGSALFAVVLLAAQLSG